MYNILPIYLDLLVELHREIIATKVGHITNKFLLMYNILPIHRITRFLPRYITRLYCIPYLTLASPHLARFILVIQTWKELFKQKQMGALTAISHAFNAYLIVTFQTLSYPSLPHVASPYIALFTPNQTWKELFKQKQMGAVAAASNEEDSKDGDGDVSSKGGEDEEEEEDEDEQQGGISVVSGGESVGTFGRGKKSSQAPAPPPVDPLHLHTVSLPLVMASVDVLFPR